MSRSLMNPLLKMDPEHWAVTMICDQNSNHARLVFEGVDEAGRSFLSVGHLIAAPGFIMCLEKDVFPVKTK